MIRISIEGDAAACSPLIPWAKRKHGALASVYGDNRWWAWRRWIGDLYVVLERQGPIDRITIKAGGLTGYEFAAAFDMVYLSGTGSYSLENVKFTVVRPAAEDGVPILSGRNSRGKAIVPALDGFADQHDAFLHAGNWDEFLAMESEATTPHHDWFQVPLPDSNEQAAEWSVSGYGGCRQIISFVSHRKRYQDLSMRAVLDFDYLGFPVIEQWYSGSAIQHRIGGKGKRLPLDMAHVVPPTPEAAGFPLVGSAALYDQFVIGASHRADDYKFTVVDYANDAAYNLSAASLFKPSWVGGDVWSKWFWRGDGRRSIALQYGWNSTTKVLDSGVHELEWVIEAGDGAPYINAATTINVHNLSTKPVGVDYDLFDQRQRRIVVFEPWVSPAYIGLDDSSDETYIRGLLIYAAFCTMDDSGIISAPYRRIAMHHAPWLEGDLTPASPSPSALHDENGAEIFGDPYTPALPNAAWRANWPYEMLRARIAAMDVRAQAFATYCEVQRSTGGGSYAIEHGKRWMIWNEIREQRWANNAGAEILPSDYIDDLESPPINYVRLQPGHPLWDNRVLFSKAPVLGYSLHRTYTDIDLFYAQAWETKFHFDGFRVNPKKHFALFVNGASRFEYSPAIPSALKNFFLFDHIERVGGEAPRVSTHYDIFNAARETAYQPVDGVVDSMAAQGIWVE